MQLLHVTPRARARYRDRSATSLHFLAYRRHRRQPAAGRHQGGGQLCKGLGLRTHPSLDGLGRPSAGSLFNGRETWVACSCVAARRKGKDSALKAWEGVESSTGLLYVCGGRDEQREPLSSRSFRP